MLITSPDNERIKRIAKLRQRKWRDLAGACFVEGIHLVKEALEVEADVESIVICPELCEKWLAAGVAVPPDIPVIEVSAKVFRRVAEFDYSQGIGAVIRQKWTPLEEVSLADELCRIAANRVQCPNDIGALARLSDAVGGKGIILVEDPDKADHPSADPYHPAAVRASLGAAFSQQLSRATLEEFAAWKSERGCQVVGTSPEGTVDYRAADYKPPLVMLMGNEWFGLSPEHQAVCDLLVGIPMAGRIPSHNVPTAAAVVVYEMLRRA